MAFFKIKNNTAQINSNSSIKKDNTNNKVKPTPTYKATKNGLVFGISAGLGDGFATVYSNKNNIKKSLAEYKGYSFSQKKEALKEILNIKGMTLKKYKDFIQKEMNVSMPKVMLKRALLYGTVLGLIGFGVDAYSNKKDKASETK